MKTRKIIVWILAILPVLGLAFWKGQEFLRLELPQQMDVLAGIATVYALVFLILGYRQQGIELTQNTDAINLQAEAIKLQTEELRKSVEQSEELVRVTRDQFEFDRKAREEEDARRKRMYQPSFVINEEKLHHSHKPRMTAELEDIGMREYGLRLHFINEGAQATLVKFELDQPHSASTKPYLVPKFENGQEIPVELHFDSSNSTLLHRIKLTVTYRTLLGDDGAEYFSFGENTRGQLRYIKYDTRPPDPPLVDSEVVG
jgi:hypothetical protein